MKTIVHEESSCDSNIEDEPVRDQATMQLRKSPRTTKPPTYLQDYHCDLVQADKSLTSPYHLNLVLSYDKLSSSFRAFTLSVSSIFEP